MSKRPSLSDIGNEGCSSEKQQRTSDTINLSPACKEKMSTFKASVETILTNIKLQTELAAIKNDYEILKNDYTKLEKLSEDYISKVDEENERLKDEHSIQISESDETLKDEQAKNDKLKSELKTEKSVCKEAKDRADELQKIVPELRATIRAKDVEILDLQQQRKEETENLEEAQNELVQANLKIETTEHELQNVKKQQKDDSAKFQKRIDEAAKELCIKEKENERKLQDVKDESENLRKRIDQVTGERDKQSKKNQEILDALNKKENELANSQNSNKLKNDEILDLRAQLEEETENLEEAQNELVQANLKTKSFERELQDVKKQQKDNNAKLQKRIDEAAKELCNKEKENERKLQDVKDESENLQKHIDQVTAERDKQIKKNQEILDALIKKENELANSQASIKLKDDEIASLNGQLNMKKQFYGTKVKELQKASEAEAARFQCETSDLKNKCGALERKIESLQSATAQEKSSWAKMDKEKELSKVERENEELKKSLENSKKDVENERAKTKKHIEDRAKEMFEEWKKKDGAKRNKENNREDRHIQKPEKKLNNDRKKSNSSFTPKCDASTSNDSNWNELLKSCEPKFLSSNSSAVTFLDSVAVSHFSKAEKMLPISEMPEKMKQIKRIIDHFFPNDTEENRESHLRNLKLRMNTVRSNAKKMEFKKCNTERCVGFTSDGNRYYYYINTSKKTVVWDPYEDKERERYIDRNYKPKFSSFRIPNQYSHCEYILIFQIFGTDEMKMFKLMPKTGCDRLIK